MRLMLAEINLDSQGFRWFYFLAHSLAVLSILGTFVFGVLQRKKSLFWFFVSTVLDYSFRIFLIVTFLLCLYGCWDFIFTAIWQPDGYWSNNHVLGYLISYLLTLTFGILATGLIIKLVLRISLVRIFAKADLLISKIPFVPAKSEADALVINDATYGTQKNKIDVTKTLNAMIVNNELTVIASNSLAGDPEPGSPKMLIVAFRYHGIQLTRAAMEGYELKLPPDDYRA
jgi:hypothetical protein